MHGEWKMIKYTKAERKKSRNGEFFPSPNAYGLFKQSCGGEEKERRKKEAEEE